MATIGSLAVNIVARTEKFTKGIGKAQSLTAKFANKLNPLNSGLTKVAAGMSAAFGSAAIIANIRSSAERLDKIGKVADKLGATTEGLAGLRLAAERTGVATSSLDTGLQRMVRRVSEAAMGTGAAKNALAELGLNAQRLNQMKPAEQFRAIAERMNQVSNQGDKVRLAMQIFDTEGVGLVNTFKLGSDGLQAMQDRAIAMGQAIDRQGIARIETMNDAIDDAKAAWGGVWNRITVEVAPAITDLATRTGDWLTRMSSGIGGITGQTTGFGKSLGWVADATDMVSVAWKFTGYTITKAIEVAVRGLDMLQKTIVDIANKIPGVSLETSSFISTWADELARKTDEQWAGVREAWLKPPASDRLAAMFDPIEEKIKGLPKPDLMPDEKTMAWIKSISTQGGGLLGQGLNMLSKAPTQAADMAAKVAEKIANQPAARVMVQAGRSDNTILERGTREAALAARGGPSKNFEMKTAENTKAAVAALKQIDKRLAKQQQPKVATL